MEEQRLAFGPFVFDTASATLWREREVVPVGGRGAALLAALLAADNGVVTKAALIEHGWPDRIVEEGNLAVQIAGLRKILGTRPDGQEWIANVARVGYRLVRDAGGEASGRPSFAVLPFVNLSSNTEQEHFADGLVEDLITAFSRFNAFTVVARQSSQAYKGSTKDMREIARELSVRYLLEGSVRREGRQVRVTAQLIDGRTGVHIWAENLDGTIDDVFAYHDRVTASVVGLIEPRIRHAEIERARRKPPENLDAYDLFLRALPLTTGARVFHMSGVGDAIDILHRAIELDPDYAAALAQCAWACEWRFTSGATPPGVDDAAEAVALSERAMQIDPNDGIVRTVAGVVQITIKGDLEGGLAKIRQAAALNPNNAIIVDTAGWAHTQAQDYDGAIAWHHRALQLVGGLPDSHWSMSGMSRAHLAAGRVEEALVWGLRALEASPGLDWSHCLVTASYALLGRMDEAKKALDETLAIWPGLTISRMLAIPEQHDAQDKLFAEGLRLAGMPLS